MSRMEEIRAEGLLRPIPIHDARDLTAGTGRAQIVLDGKVYDLRITRAGKLILTK